MSAALRTGWHLGLLLVATCAAYHNTLSNLFVLDDYHFILENPALRLDRVPGFFLHAYPSAGVEYYRPLSVAALALDRALFGTAAWGFHAHNVLWHLTATLAVWTLLRRVFPESESPWAATLGALVFAVHPVHTEAVAGVVGRMELMAGCFTFWCIDAQLSGRRGVAAVMALLAMWSKESGVVAPFLAVSLDAWRLGDPARAAVRGLGFLVPIGAYGLLRIGAMTGAGLPTPSGYFLVSTWSAGWWTAVDCLGRYLGLSLWPHPLSADYSYPALPISDGPGSPRTALTLLCLFGVAAAAVLLRRRFAWFTAAVCTFFVAILPVSNLVVRINVLLAERVLYIPTLAVAILVAGIWSERVVGFRSGVRGTAAMALVVSLGLLTLARNVDWETPLSLWADTVEKVPRSGLAHGNYALACATIEDWDCARREIRAAIALNPGVAYYVEAQAVIDRRAAAARTGPPRRPDDNSRE